MSDDINVEITTIDTGQAPLRDDEREIITCKEEMYIKIVHLFFKFNVNDIAPPPNAFYFEQYEELIETYNDLRVDEERFIRWVDSWVWEQVEQNE